MNGHTLELTDASTPKDLERMAGCIHQTPTADAQTKADWIALRSEIGRATGDGFCGLSSDSQNSDGEGGTSSYALTSDLKALSIDFAENHLTRITLYAHSPFD